MWLSRIDKIISAIISCQNHLLSVKSYISLALGQDKVMAVLKKDKSHKFMSNLAI